MVQTVFRLSGNYARVVYSLRGRVITIQTKEGQHPPEVMQDMNMRTISDWTIEWDTPRWLRIMFIEGVETEILTMEVRKVEARYLLNDDVSLLADGKVVCMISERNTPSVTITTISV